ncbi:MFS transporter [Nakamurella sp. PAMC28650]|uniref:MFS transporter n=1 Tax=Nakamurella sp. PAMC28650 TaxID=2762325 RepID=UPI00164CE053|nr:MFS transporter [Nakamurella sp. PAMC28650]QNK79490.1 MFS transporter [Nakamurella sp. PAMC28650]
MVVAPYAAVLRRPGAIRPFVATVVARLPIAMAPLGMVVLVQNVTGSYAIAGLVTGGFAVGTSVGAPVWGRMMDRLGQARVIVPTVLASAVLIAALALGAVGGAPAVWLVALAAAAGLTFPPFGAAMRSTWRLVVPEGPERRAGFALDAVAVESLFVGGPLFLSLLLVVSPPVVPLLVSAVLLAAGGLAYSATEPARRRPPHGRRSRPGEIVSGRAKADGSEAGRARAGGSGPGRLMAGGLPVVLVISAALSIGFGVIDTSLAATARQVLGHQGWLGLLFAAIAGASVIGGLAYGTRATHDREQRRLPVALGVFALGLAPVPFLIAAGRPSLWALLPLLFLAGLAIAPALIMLQNIVDRVAPAARHQEAQAWLSTSSTTGGAAGTAVAGLAVDAAGVPAALGLAVIAVLLSCLLAVLGRGVLAGSP